MSYMSITAGIDGIRVQRVVHPDFNSIIIKIVDHDGHEHRINVVELLAEKGEKVEVLLCYVICCLTINEFRFLRKLIVLASRSNFPKTLFLFAYVFMVTFTGIPVL